MSEDEAGQSKPSKAVDGADDLRDKFRAALERKHDKGAAGAGGAAGEAAAKASARTSNSKRQREFRRKSGG